MLCPLYPWHISELRNASSCTTATPDNSLSYIFEMSEHSPAIRRRREHDRVQMAVEVALHVGVVYRKQ
jgi:hypothetical protein